MLQLYLLEPYVPEVGFHMYTENTRNMREKVSNLKEKKEDKTQWEESTR